MDIYVLYTFNCIGMTINIFELNWIEYEIGVLGQNFHCAQIGSVAHMPRKISKVEKLYIGIT